jgi:hypothetical protein
MNSLDMNKGKPSAVKLLPWQGPRKDQSYTRSIIDRLNLHLEEANFITQMYELLIT